MSASKCSDSAFTIISTPATTLGTVTCSCSRFWNNMTTEVNDWPHFILQKLPLQEAFIYIIRWHSSACLKISHFLQLAQSQKEMESAPENKRSPIANYEYKVEQRAMKHREISHRNNTTTCRSPTRDLDTRQMKNELHLKRQSEFFKRRPVDHGTCSLLSPVPRRRYPRETLHATQHMTHTLTSIRRPLITSQNVKLQRDGITLAKQVQSYHCPVTDCWTDFLVYAQIFWVPRFWSHNKPLSEQHFIE